MTAVLKTLILLTKSHYISGLRLHVGSFSPVKEEEIWKRFVSFSYPEIYRASKLDLQFVGDKIWYNVSANEQ